MKWLPEDITAIERKEIQNQCISAMEYIHGFEDISTTIEEDEGHQQIHYVPKKMVTTIQSQYELKFVKYINDKNKNIFYLKNYHNLLNIILIYIL